MNLSTASEMAVNNHTKVIMMKKQRQYTLTNKCNRFLLILLTLLIGISIHTPNASAALLNDDFLMFQWRGFDELRLWVTDVDPSGTSGYDVDFVDWNQPSQWATDFQTDKYLQGSRSNGNTWLGNWNITFSNDPAPTFDTAFTMQYQRLRDGVAVAQGSYIFDGNSWTRIPGQFTNPPVPTPLPQSVLLLASGVFGLVIIRRRKAY